MAISPGYVDRKVHLYLLSDPEGKEAFAFTSLKAARDKEATLAYKPLVWEFMDGYFHFFIQHGGNCFIRSNAVGSVSIIRDRRIIRRSISQYSPCLIVMCIAVLYKRCIDAFFHNVPDPGRE